MAGTVNNSTQNHSTAEKVESYEVGWLFVQQYYSVLNEDPTRLHCFYTKKSTQTIGGEGESVPLCHGQQEIHNRFIELDFRDCRVLVSNVDSQASLDGGIIIQVLGEIANKGGPSKKFCQTFFLAEQPNGYFVLNDIFRYLKDEVETDYEANPSLEEPTEIAEAQPEAPVAEAPAKVEQAPVQPVVAEVQPVKPKAPEPTPAKQEVPEQKSVPEPTKPEAKASPSAPVSTKPEATVTPAAAPAPAAAKSWATLAANNSDRWGSNASATQGVVAPAAKPQQSTPAPQQQQQPGRNMSNKDNRNKNDDLVVFVRNVNESITQDILSQAFSTFGPVKSVDLFHTKNSAFVEFEDVEHVKAAIAQGTISVGGHNLIAEKKRSRAPQGSSQNTGSGPRTGSQGGSYERNNSRRGGRGNTRGGRPSGDRQPAK